MHAVKVRNDWLKQAMAEAEETDKASGVWDTEAIRQSLPRTSYLGAAGDEALVVGLRGRAELNGEVGTLLHWVVAKERWAVRVREGERVLVRPINLYSQVPVRVLSDVDLRACMLSFLPADDLLHCAQTCHSWAVAATQDALWLPQRREQRDARVPWSPLTPRLEAETAARPGFRGWAAEYRQALVDSREREGLQGMPVWSRGANGEADWPGVVCNQQLGADEDVMLGHVGGGRYSHAGSITWPSSPDHVSGTARPIEWEEGLAKWRRSEGGAYSEGEEPARSAARNAAVQEMLRALADGVDLVMRYVPSSYVP